MPAPPAHRKFGLGASSIRVAPGLISHVAAIAKEVCAAHRYAVITDSNVGPIYARQIKKGFSRDKVDVLTISAGESNKTRDTWGSLTDQMLVRGFGRDSAVIALGGGVVGDLAGFVAATFMRGVPVVQVPTSLMAMVDAAIGGKTAVDTPAGKNLVGVFHAPAAIVVDPQVLTTLPLNELRAGFAEVIKHGVIADEPYLRTVVGATKELLAKDGPTSDSMLAAIVHSIEIKAGIVSRDEREEGLRKTLNFGHTIGHAIELVSGYSLLHGEAIAIGMALEGRLAERAGVAEPGTADAIVGALRAFSLPTTLPDSFESDAVIAAMGSDKKARAGKTRFALPSKIGRMAGEETGWTIAISNDQLREVLA
jgi:3-dehydroquinate synthase